MKKPAIRLILIGALSILFTPSALKAQFNFVTTNGTITLTRYVGTGGVVTIPATTNGLPVTVIGGSCFSSLPSLISVTIPDSVAEIGTNAFYRCINLTNVTIGNGTTNIRPAAFRFCPALLTISIPDSVLTLGSNAFSSCSQLSSVHLGQGLQQIENDTFNSCFNLASINISDAITNIGSGAFSSCTHLTNCPVGLGVRTIGDGAFSLCAFTNLDLPAGLTTIGASAFSQCNALTNVTIPAGVTNIGAAPFTGSKALTAILVDSGNPCYLSADGVLFDKDQKSLIECPGTRAGTFAVPDSVKIIKKSAFASCTGLTAISMADQVTQIEDFAFFGCSSLISIRMSSSLGFLGVGSFEQCSALTNVTIPRGVNWIQEATFYYCVNLQSIFFQSYPPYILGNSAFGADNNARVYYLPGTTGWQTTYGGLPAVPWDPQVQMADATFGVQSNRFGFTVTGQPDIPIVIEAAESPVGSAWTFMQSCNLTNGSVYFSDPDSTNHPARFYRIRSP